jgi:hypothetical protein
MKTTINQPIRKLPGLSAVALAAIVLAHPANAAPGDDEPGIVTARFMYAADQQDALADYNVALANANNGPTADARISAAKRATKDYEAALETVKKQFNARKTLCRDLGEVRYNPKIDPADFLSPAEVAADPNPLFPLVPGTTNNYRAVDEEGTETIAFEITHRTRMILGVTCIVVHDAVHLDGSLIEDTDDWFAQDRDGNVWYFGESTAEYEDGLITTTDGAWEAGVEGARPGIIMFAKPKVGKTYRQELFLGEAEDAAEILALDKTVTVPAGTFSNCLKTREFTPLEPGASERKYYAPGIGTVLEVNPESGKRTELISVVKE